MIYRPCHPALVLPSKLQHHCHLTLICHLQFTTNCNKITKFIISLPLHWLCQVNYSAIGRPAVNSQEESTSAAVEAPKWMKENIKYFLLNLMLFTSLFVFFKIKIYLSADWKHSGGSQFCILISFARQCAFSCASLESWKLCRSRCSICRQKVPCVLKGGKYTFRYKHKRNTERGKNVFKH